MEGRNKGKNRVVFFTNREMGNQEYTPKQEWERPSMKLFWKTIKDQVNSLGKESNEDVDISKVVVKKEWKVAWATWKNCMSNLNAKEQLLFLQNFEVLSNQEDLDGMIVSIANELEKKFKTTHEKAVNLHQKLCYQLMWWATSIGNKKEIEKENVMEALSLYGDSVKGEHFFPICEPFFQSRIIFVADLENTILNGKSKVTFLTGDPGCGKTNIVSYLACKPDSIVTLRFHAFRPIIPGDLYVSADSGISNPIPENVPENVRFILAGQLTHQFSEYPDFLSDTDRIEEMQIPNIERSDLELLYEKSSLLMKYAEHEKVLVINYIAEIAKGNTLSGVFAMQEATKYSNFAILSRIAMSKS